MEEKLHPKHEEIEKKSLLDGAETAPDDPFEIDPADFIDPDEFGQRPSVRGDRDMANWDTTHHA